MFVCLVLYILPYLLSYTSNTNNTNKKKFTPPAFNIQIDVGDGDHIAFFGGSTNVDVKVGNGAHYTLMYGDNNILVSVGHAGDTNRFIEIGGYRALEGVQILIGTKNVVVNGGVNFFLFVLFVLLVLLVLLVLFVLFVLALSFSWLTDLAKLVCCLSISTNFCLVLRLSRIRRCANFNRH
jgi:hypothetical protein